jgi:hypothetical protein
MANMTTMKIVVLRELSLSIGGAWLGRRGAGSEGRLGGGPAGRTLGPSGRTGFVATCGEAYQRASDIVKQTRPRPLAGAHARDEDIVAAGDAVERQERPGGLPKAALRAVAGDGVADLLGGGEAFADMRQTVAAVQHLDHDGAPAQG